MCSYNTKLEASQVTESVLSYLNVTVTLNIATVNLNVQSNTQPHKVTSLFFVPVPDHKADNVPPEMIISFSDDNKLSLFYNKELNLRNIMRYFVDLTSEFLDLMSQKWRSILPVDDIIAAVFLTLPQSVVIAA